MTAIVDERRAAFVQHLYRLQRNLTSPNPKWVAEARQAMARLRRSLTSARHQAEAYQIVFAQDPPTAEQDTWLLVAGLFALHPQPRPSGRGPRSLGASMRQLTELRGSAADRRFVQLLSVDAAALPHYLRQALRLLSTQNVPVDYHQLLDDLVILLGEHSRDDQAHRVRLNWARDFHRRPSTTSSVPSATVSGDPQ